MLRRYCFDCGYDLNHCPGPMCPECGRGFNHADPSSLSDTGAGKRRWPMIVAIVLASYPMIPLAFVYVEYVVNWRHHGHRPNYETHWHMPDGWNAMMRPLFEGLGWGYVVAVTGMFVFGAVLLSAKYRVQRAAVWFLVPPIGWIAWVLYAVVIDPMGVVNWWFD